MEKAINLNKKAVEADRKQKYKEALSLYEEAVECYLNVLKYEVNGDKATASVREKCDECLVRINELKKHIPTKTDSQATAKEVGSRSFKLSSMFSKPTKRPQAISVERSTILEKAVQLSTKADDADKEEKYEEALRLYHQAIQYYVHVLKFEVQKGNETFVRMQLHKIYLRVENLEKHLKKNKKDSEIVEGASSKPLSSSLPIVDQKMILKCTGRSVKKAIEVATKAIDFDKEEKYEDALQLYNEAIKYFLYALKFEAIDQEDKNLVRKQCDKLLTRAEEVKKFLKKSQGVTSLKKANELSTKAAGADREEKYEEALGLYKQALQYYLHALKYEVQKYERTSIRIQCDKLLQRAKELENYLKKIPTELKMGEEASFKLPPLPVPVDHKLPNGLTVISTGKSLEKAIELSIKAADADKEEKYEEALRLYNEAIQYYLHALKFEVQNDKTVVIAQCDKFIQRAEELDKYLKKSPKETEIVKGASSNPKIPSLPDQRPEHDITGLKSLMDKAVELSMKAIDADREGKFEEAVKLYRETFQHYIDAYKCADANNNKAKVCIKGQCDRYLVRMTQLQMHLNSQAASATEPLSSSLNSLQTIMKEAEKSSKK